jgi:hypothetical protein
MGVPHRRGGVLAPRVEEVADRHRVAAHPVGPGHHVRASAVLGVHVPGHDGAHPFDLGQGGGQLGQRTAAMEL